MNLREGKWLVAVSCGPDSMALTHWCLQQGIKIALAHVNYHHQKKAKEEEAYIRAYAGEHNLSLFVKNEPFVYEGNFEAEARKYRYAFFAEIVKAHGFTGVLTAHQQDDLLETYFMQIEKQLGVNYYGMREEVMIEGVLVKRPLLHKTKQELLDYCNKNHVFYFLDESNEDTSYTRNRIRKQVFPLTFQQRTLILQEIEKKNAIVKERNCRIAAYLQQGQNQLSFYRCLEEEDRLFYLRFFLFKQLDKQLRTAQLKEIDTIFMKQDDFVIPFQDMELVQEDGRFFFHVPYRAYSYCIENPKALTTFHCERLQVQKGSHGVYSVLVLKNDYPLTIRNVEKGDKIEMCYGHKTVHRFFIDRHIPRYLRNSWPIVLNAKNEVILLPGLGCNKNRFSIKPSFDMIELHSY